MNTNKLICHKIAKQKILFFPQIIYSSILSGVNDKMTIVKNAVDGVRHPMKIWVNKNNNGGSHVRQLGLSKDPSQYEAGEVVQTVLLSDIFEEAFRKSQPKNVIIKADIETFECRAFLGSPQGKNHLTNILVQCRITFSKWIYLVSIY